MLIYFDSCQQHKKGKERRWPVNDDFNHERTIHNLISWRNVLLSTSEIDLSIWFFVLYFMTPQEEKEWCIYIITRSEQSIPSWNNHRYCYRQTVRLNHSQSRIDVKLAFTSKRVRKNIYVTNKKLLYNIFISLHI